LRAAIIQIFNHMFNKITSFYLVVICFFLLLPSAVGAFSWRKGEQVTTDKEETIEENLIIFSPEITLNGRINGDVFFLGSRLLVDGEINGDLIGLAKQIIIKGRVNGDVRAGAAEKIEIQGEITGQTSLSAAKIDITETAHLNKDLYFFATSLNVGDARIDRDLSGWAQQISFSGTVGRQAHWRELEGKNNFLTVFPSAKIGGDLAYNFTNGVSLSEKALIGGKTEQLAKPEPEKKSAGEKFIAFLWPLLIAIFSSFLVGLVLIYFTPALIAATDRGGKNFWPTFAHGLLVFFACPMIALILILMIIGWPLGLMLGAAWLAAMFCGRVLVALAAGRWLGKKIPWLKRRDGGPNRVTREMAAGVIVAQILFHLPYLGWAFSLAAIWLGLGIIWEKIKPQNQSEKPA